MLCLNQREGIGLGGKGRAGRSGNKDMKGEKGQGDSGTGTWSCGFDLVLATLSLRGKERE